MQADGDRDVIAPAAHNFSKEETSYGILMTFNMIDVIFNVIIKNRQKWAFRWIITLNSKKVKLNTTMIILVLLPLS